MLRFGVKGSEGELVNPAICDKGLTSSPFRTAMLNTRESATCVQSSRASGS